MVLNPAGQALLRSVQDAFAQLDDGVQAAAAASSGEAPRLRVTVLPSFAQRWLMPRIGRWRERHPTLALEIDSSIRAVDLLREGFHAAIRQGKGPWPGLEAERLFDAPPIVVVGSPSAARRLLGAQPEALAREPLLGDADIWKLWFAAAGVRTNVTTVAVFNDAGLMPQAAEQSLGLALSREILAADALCDGRLVRLSPVSITHPGQEPYHLVYPPNLRDWPPLVSLRRVAPRRTRPVGPGIARAPGQARPEIAASARARRVAHKRRRMVVYAVVLTEPAVKTMTLVAKHLYFGLDPLRLRDAANRVLSRLPEDTTVRATVRLDALVEDFRLAPGTSQAIVEQMVATGVLTPLAYGGADYAVTTRFREIARARIIEPLARPQAQMLLTHCGELATRFNRTASRNKYEIDALAVHGSYMSRQPDIADCRWP